MATNIKILIVVLISLLMNACGGNPDEFRIVFRDTDRTDAALQQNFDRAADAWYKAIGRRATISDSGYSTLIVVDLVDGDENAYGLTRYGDMDDASFMEIKSGLNKYSQFEAFLHELGHHFGCRGQESENPEDVMFGWSGERGLEITQSDIDCVNGN